MLKTWEDTGRDGISDIFRGSLNVKASTRTTRWSVEIEGIEDRKIDSGRCLVLTKD